MVREKFILQNPIFAGDNPEVIRMQNGSGDKLDDEIEQLREQFAAIDKD